MICPNFFTTLCIGLLYAVREDDVILRFLIVQLVTKQSVTLMSVAGRYVFPLLRRCSECISCPWGVLLVCAWALPGSPPDPHTGRRGRAAPVTLSEHLPLAGETPGSPCAATNVVVVIPVK